MNHRRIPSLLIVLLLCLLPMLALATEPPPPRIGVATMEPGEVFFERFGHDALVVEDPIDGHRTSFNFGFFDPEEPGFVSRFASGEMMYYLVALPFEQDLQQYQEEGRGVSIQWLDLQPQQARELALALQQRSQSAEARYHYDYFTANCATMVRDSIDRAMGGALKAQLAGRSRGNTYRSEAVRLASPSFWMWTGFDLGLGPYADKPLSRWQEAFVPMRLADSLTQVKNSDGRPLVASTERLSEQRLPPEPAEQARRAWPWLLAGVVIALAVLSLRRHRRGLAALAVPVWLLCGLAGLLLVYLWGFTAHQAAWANRNLLLFNPLCLLALAGAVPLLRQRQPGRWFNAVLWLMPLASLLALLIHWLSFQPQYNLQWIGLLMPIHLALAIALTNHPANRSH